jgi:hypothetical protein
MNMLLNKNISSLHLANPYQSYNDEQLNNDNKTNNSLFHRFQKWLDLIRRWKHKRVLQVCIYIIYRSIRMKYICHRKG